MFKEWFWSECSANRAADRLRKQGWVCDVAYKMRADGTHDWQVSAVAA